MLLHLSSNAEQLTLLIVRLQCWDIGWRGRWRSAEQSLKYPLAALHYRRSIRVRRDRENTSLPQQSAAVSIREPYAAKLRAVDLRYAVVLRQPLIQVRIIGTQQVQHA